MCNAYSNHAGLWLVQPMFIKPKSLFAAGYKCSTARDAAGEIIVDEVSAPMANQVDSIYALP